MTTAIATAPDVKALAILVDMKQVTFKDLLPYVNQARMIDIRINSWYLPTLQTLPAFDLHIGDHVITYDKAHFSNYCTVTVLIRSGLVPSKIPGAGGMYSQVEKSESKPVNKRDMAKLLAALQARCSGTPWYHNNSLSSWSF